MQMDKRISMIVGAALILFGLMAFASTVVSPIFGFDMISWGLPRLWPVTITTVGWFFVLPALLFRKKRGMAAFYFPGLPILATGSILLFTSVTGWWNAWEWLWPLEVLSVALAFAAAAWQMRVIWLLIPAFIIGANGLLFQFCAITGLWEVWAVMWTIEPFSIGAAFLLIGALKHKPGLTTAGLVLGGVSGIALVGMTALISMTAIFAGWWLFKLVGPAVIILAGILLLLNSQAKQAKNAVPQPKWPR